MEDRNLNKRVRNTLFFLMVFVLIFDSVPKPIQMNFIGGPVGGKLEFYPLMAAFIYSFYCQYRYRNVFVDFKVFCKYAAIFVGMMMLATIVGLIDYPYYDLILNGPADQIEKLPKVMSFLQAHGIFVEQKHLMQVWLIAREIKGVLLEAFWCLGGAYLVYAWYKDEWSQALRLAVRAVTCSCCVLLVYAIVEVLYLAGNETAKEILSFINPYIHPIVTNHGWWPPLLWKGQLRLVFPEPSHVGNYIAFGLPLIWYGYIQADTNRRAALPLTMVMAFLVFMTKARTAYAMLAGMLLLLVCLIFGGRQYELLKKFAVLIVCVTIGFVGYVSFVKTTSLSRANQAQSVVQRTLEDNLVSLASNNKRSNGAKYGLLKAHFRTGLQHPLLGVGKGLTGVYVADNFTPEEAANGEISSWIRYQEERGPMAAGYSMPDAMNEFVSRFSSTGILGLGTFLFPFAYVLLRLLKKWVIRKDLTAMMMMLALISSMMAGCNGSLNLMYAVWLLLGLSYAVAFGRERSMNE